ncbi:MAG: hypothetical protein K9L02_04665 [Acholeplasmataceae bacterium]|nr:hypothetical protein [Acholeplasmataceae bacterium]
MSILKKSIVFLLIMIFGIWFFFHLNAQSIDDFDKDGLYYDKIKDNINDYTYVVTTDIYTVSSKEHIKYFEETYLYDKNYLYSRYKSRNEKTELFETREKLVLFKNSETFNYERVSWNDSGIEAAMTPYIKKNDSSSYDGIMSLINHPAFYINQALMNQGINYCSLNNTDIPLTDFNLTQQQYITSIVRMYDPSYSISANQTIRVRIVLHEDFPSAEQAIYIDYSTLINNDDITLKQKVVIEEDIEMSLSELSEIYNNALDPNTSISTLPHFSVDSTVTVYASSYINKAIYYFFAIETSGDYKFSIDQSSTYVNWFLMDCGSNVINNIYYRDLPYFDFENELSLEYIHLDPGVYYINILDARDLNHRDNFNFSIDTFEVSDDYSNTFSDQTAYIDSPGTYNFDTQYNMDYDTFVLNNNFDYVVLEFNQKDSQFYIVDDTFLGCVSINQPIQLIIYNPSHQRIDLIIHSKVIGEGSFSVNYYNKEDVQATFQDAKIVDIFKLGEKVYVTNQLDGVAYLSIDLDRSMRIEVTCANSTVQLYNSNGQVIERAIDGTYQLQPGSYYIKIYDFIQFYDIVNIFIDDLNKDHYRILTTGLTSYTFYGIVDEYNYTLYMYDLFSSPEKSYLYEITFETDVYVTFEEESKGIPLFFGIDNTRLSVIDTSLTQTYFFSAGKYNIIMPSNENYYLFVMNISTVEQQS